MRILFVCHRFPFPPKRGGKIRPFNIIKHLSEKHKVVVASPVRSAEEAEAGAGLGDYCSTYVTDRITKPMAAIHMLSNLAKGRPVSMGYFYSARLHHQIQEKINKVKFDLILVHCSSVAQYVEDATGITKIMDFGDMDSQKWVAYGKTRQFPLNLIYRIEGIRLQRAEADLAGKFDYSTCTTLEEMRTLESYNVGVRTSWFPNGVDTEYFKPSEEPYEPDTICFIGRMDYYPNQECMQDFCADTLPLIRRMCPRVKMFIVGADPSPAIKDLEKIPGVVVTGSVPDVRPYVWRCAVNVAPLKIARGTQNKILESLAMGVPSIASVNAAVGIDAEPGTHFLTASTPEECAEAVVNLLSNNGERQRYSEAGRARMLSHHSWEGSMRKLDRIIEDCMSTSGQGKK
jgi:polysaccharide biosynthesis protein PslH